MIDELTSIVINASNVDYCEARFHKRSEQKISISKGEFDEVISNEIQGVCFRVNINGTWGFSSTGDLNKTNLNNTLLEAISSAKSISSSKSSSSFKLADANLAKGKFSPPIDGPLDKISIEEKIKLVKDSESEARTYRKNIKSASSSYRELLDSKIIVTNDGVSAEIFDSKPEFRVSVVVQNNGELYSSSEAVGVTGGWNDLFSKSDALTLSRNAAEKTCRLANSRTLKGGRSTVILDPALVGLISHEAIGHTVEADFVLSGSIAKDMIGKKVASDIVTMVDSGPSAIVGKAGGTLLVDDEGVLTESTVLVDNGVLSSYLHNRESAELFSVSPTGNSRAYEYHNEPLIRMRNTFIEPGDWTLDDLISDTKSGYLLKGAKSGQADANGEFMFGTQEAYLIERGEIKDLFRGVTISGQAYDVLKTVDALSDDFSYEIGSGYCGKGQLAKVDGGGPHLRCEVVLGGEQ